MLKKNRRCEIYSKFCEHEWYDVFFYFVINEHVI